MGDNHDTTRAKNDQALLQLPPTLMERALSERRLVIVQLDSGLITSAEKPKNLFYPNCIPVDSVFIECHYSHQTRCFQIVVCHPSFSMVAAHARLPIVGFVSGEILNENE